MRRRHLVLAGSVALLTAATWLVSSDSGLQACIRLATQLSGGQLQIDQASGQLSGPLAFGQLRWTAPDLQVEVRQLHLDWHPSALLHGQLQVAELRAGDLHITKQASTTPTPAPTELRLPLAVEIKKLSIARLDYGDALSASDLAARFSSNGQQHRLEDFQARSAGIAISGRARLDGAAPLPLTASAEITGQYEQRPLAMTITAQGPLERLTLSAVAAQGIAGHAEIVLTPFAEAAFASARVLLEDIDPAVWLAGAPQARLSITADVEPQGSGVAGSFGLTNHQPGPLDRQQLPLGTLTGTLTWQGSEAHFAHLHASLPGNGELAGSGAWQDAALNLVVTASRLDASRLVSTLHPTRLNGPLSATLSANRQAVKIDLQDKTFKLQAEASQSNEQVELTQLQLAAGDARLNAHGKLDLKSPRQFAADGELQRFDPSRFAKLPAAQINASFKAAGRLMPEATVDASFALTDSRLAGQPLAGQGQVSIAWPHIPQVDVELAAGANRLRARGAFGQPGDTLNIAIDAPQLAPYGLEGGLTGKFEVTGGSRQPHFAGNLDAARLGLPGAFRLNAFRFKTEGGGEAASPLLVELDVASVDTPDTPGLLKAGHLLITGSNQTHRLSGSTDVAGKNRLSLLAEGALADDFKHWQGTLLEAKLASSDTSRNFRLTTPAPIRLAATGWNLGPVQLAGDPLDWQASLQAAADARQLQASLKVRGSRIGQVDGELSAAMRDAWDIDRQARWQGRLKSDIADLGWLAELIGEGWQSEGRLAGELQLAGTPAAPLSSGRLRGEKLALRLPGQGLNLANGELDVALRDNLLRIRQLAFDSLLQPLPRPLRVDARDDLSGLTKQPGRLEVSGEMRIDKAQAPDSAFLDFRLDRLGAYQSPDQWVAVSGEGRLSWQEGTLGAQGKLAVDAGYWQLAPGGTPRLSDDVVVKRPGSDQAATSLRPRLNLDITTDLGRNFRFNGAGLSSRLAGEVRITARGRDLPRASGTIRARDGRFDAYGQKLEIERGILNFNGLLENPGLDVRAVRKGLSVEPGVQISGTAQKPVIKLVSDPELPDAEKLAWLVLGHGPEQMGAGDATLLISAAGGLLGNDAGNITQQIKKTFGFDELGIRQGNLGDSGGRQQVSRVAGGNSVDTTSTTGQQILSVGKRLSSKALLSYEQTLGRAEGIVKLTVNLTRQIAVIGRAGSDNALDVFYTLSFGRESAADKTGQPAGQRP